MNLEDLIDENGLQQDEWSLSNPVFGKEDQLQVVGWNGKNKKGKGAKYYIVRCSKCSSDSELFNGGYFKSDKAGLIRDQHLVDVEKASSGQKNNTLYSVNVNPKN